MPTRISFEEITRAVRQCLEDISNERSRQIGDQNFNAIDAFTRFWSTVGYTESLRQENSNQFELE